MTINTRQDFLERFNGINQIINSNHDFISNEPNPSRKRSAMRQINTEKGYAIEQIRLKLANGQNVTEDEVATLRKELSQYYASRHRNNVAARFFLNLLPAVITGPIFHVFYWIIDKIVVAIQASKAKLSQSISIEEAQANNKSAKFRWDWTKTIPSIGSSFSTLKQIKSFLDDTKEFDVGILSIEKTEENGDSDLVNSLEVQKPKKAKRKAKSKVEKKDNKKPATKVIFEPAIVNTDTLEAEVDLKPLQKLEAEKQKDEIKFSFEPVVINANTLEAEVELKPLQKLEADIQKEATLLDTAKRMLETVKLSVQPTLSAFANITAPKVKPVSAPVNPELSLVPATKVNVALIMDYRSPQPKISAQPQAGIFSTLKATGQKLWEGLSNPPKLFADTLATFSMLKKPAPVKPLTIAEAQPVAKASNAVEQVVFVEHTYAGIINGNELVDLKLFVTICGEDKSTEAFIYRADGRLLGQYTSADAIRMAFPSLQIDVDFEANLLTNKESASDVESEEDVVEQARVVVLEDEAQAETAEPTTPVKELSRWERFKAGLSEVVETVKDKLSPQKNNFTPSTPDDNAMMQSPKNSSGLPVERVRMEDGDVNYVNDATANPSYIIDMDKLVDESSSVSIFKALSPANLVVLDDSGHVVRQPGDVVVALDFGADQVKSDNFDPFAELLGANSMSSSAYAEVFQPIASATGNPFVEAATEEAKRDDLSLQVDTGEDSGLEIF